MANGPTDQQGQTSRLKDHTYQSRWEVWVRIFLSFLLGALSASFFVGGKSRDIDSLLEWKGEAKTTLARMDREGTSRSHWVDEQQSQQIAANAAAIQDIRAKAELRGEVISVMQGKIERLEADTKRNGR